MVDQTDLEVVALNFVYEDMTAQVDGRNMGNELALSNLDAMVDKVVHVGIDFHTTTVDQCQDKNIYVNDNQNSVEKIQEPYLHLPDVNFFFLPQHSSIQLQAALL